MKGLKILHLINKILKAHKINNKLNMQNQTLAIQIKFKIYAINKYFMKTKYSKILFRDKMYINLIII